MGWTKLIYEGAAMAGFTIEKPKGGIIHKAGKTFSKDKSLATDL
jgi:hypothetical protein